MDAKLKSTLEYALTELGLTAKVLRDDNPSNFLTPVENALPRIERIIEQVGRTLLAATEAETMANQWREYGQCTECGAVNARDLDAVHKADDVNGGWKYVGDNAHTALLDNTAAASILKQCVCSYCTGAEK